MFIKQLFFISIFFLPCIAQADVDIESWVTNDGSKVYFVESDHLPILDVSVSFKAGSVRDSEINNGIASFTNHLMLLGSGGENEVDIANNFTNIGAQLDSRFDQDSSSFSLRSLIEKKDTAIQLFKKVLHKPDFNEYVIKREKKRYIASIRQSDTQPASIGSKSFMKTIFGKHPYGLPQSGTEKTINKITKSQLKTFYNKFYLSNQASIVIVGDIDKKTAKVIASNISSGLPKNLNTVDYPEVEKTQGKNINIPHPSSQAHLFYGAPAFKRGDPDFFPLYVGNYILGGGGFVSRLTSEVREKNGLAYSVYSYFMPYLEVGPFQVGLQTKKDQIGKAMKIVNTTLEDFIENGPTEKELIAAKSNMIGGFPLRLDSNQKILQYLTMMAFYDYPLDYLKTFPDSVNSVTTDQIKKAFQKKVKIKDFSTVIVGVN